MLAARLLRTRVFGQPFFLLLALFASATLLSRPSKAAEHPGSDYVGVYTIDEGSRFTVVTDSAGKLYVRMTGQPFFPVTSVGDDKYVLNGGAATLTFTRTNDHVSDMTLSQGGDDINASRVDATVPPVIFPDPDSLLDFVGKYQFTSGVQYEVTMKARALWVRFAGQASYPVYPDKTDHFLYDIVDASISFERDAKGSITGLTLKRNGIDQHATRIHGN